LQAIGGREQWQNLRSRVADMIVIRYDASNSMLKSDKISSQTNFFLAPANHLELTIENLKQSIYCLHDDCNWYYSEKINYLHFFGPEPIHFDNAYPRVNALEVLNLKMINKVVIEEGMYRIDFKDGRQKDGIQSLYFDRESYLVMKRSSLSNNEVRWSFIYENYQQKEGYTEPYLIKLMANNDIYMTYQVEEIDYSVKLNPALFDPPKPCKDAPGYEILDAPHYLMIN
jgi:hypothetical protein